MAAGADAALVARLNAAIEVGMAPAVWADLQPDRAAVHEISGRARSFGELNANEDFSHIKACEGSTCTLLFLDKTHGRGRRWCSMAACGNRAKQAAHRQRLRASQSP